MTDGTSQGLFIVVAIVIFGIFVLMAYILFEDTLSPALANMFSTATEQATKSTTQSIISASDWKDWQYYSDTFDKNIQSDYLTNSGRKIVMENEPGFKGLYLDASTFEPNKNYELTFDYKVTEGTVLHLGGHLAISTDTKVYVDNVLIPGNWHDMTMGSYPQDNNKHRVKIVFNTNRHHAPITSDTGNPTWDKRLYLQPNRYNPVFGYRIVFENFKLIEK